MDTKVYLWSPTTRRHLVGQVVFGVLSKLDVPGTAKRRRNNRLVLLDSEHRSTSPRATLMSLTIRCPTR